ncbi:MAG: hypothetical protein KIT84_10720 [Labilithrix sp.]|nr:hypothetical protein [Labilithrix sp.]MCW5811479.1 hypothetical protein [Labilithrix sp.]
MAIAVHPRLAGVGFDVAYRGSTEPQTLDVVLELTGPAELPLAPWAVGGFVACVNRGLAGSSDFAPSMGRAALEAGPTGEGDPAPDELGPRYAFRLLVAGVAPVFLRVFVEHLAGCAHPSELKTISIVGSLPPDGTRLSVRDRELEGWLTEPSAYPRAWPEPGFRVETRSIPRGATIEVSLEKGELAPFATELEETISTWQTALLGYPNAKRQGRGASEPHASFARTRTSLHAKLGLFDHARGPAQAALVNALTRFHTTVARIAEVAISMP